MLGCGVDLICLTAPQTIWGMKSKIGNRVRTLQSLRPLACLQAVDGSNIWLVLLARDRDIGGGGLLDWSGRCLETCLRRLLEKCVSARSDEQILPRLHK